MNSQIESLMIPFQNKAVCKACFCIIYSARNLIWKLSSIPLFVQYQLSVQYKLSSSFAVAIGNSCLVQKVWLVRGPYHGISTFHEIWCCSICQVEQVQQHLSSGYLLGAEAASRNIIYWQDRSYHVNVLPLASPRVAKVMQFQGRVGLPSQLLITQICWP